MYPNQPQNPLDYLNQIAPQQQRTSRFTRRQKMIGGVLGGLILLVIVLSIVASSGGTNKTSLETLAAKLQATSTISTAAQPNIKDSDLQSLNVTLQLYLTNINRTIVAPFKLKGVDTTSLDKSIVSANSGSDISSKLEDARLNAVFDNTYAREMAYQLSTIITLMQQIYDNTNSTSLKSFLSDEYKNLTPIQTQFSNYNSTDS